MKDFKIVMTGPGRGEVWLGGEKVESVVQVQFVASVNTVNRLILVLNVGNGEITGMGDVARRYSWGWWRCIRAPLWRLRERVKRWWKLRSCEHDWQPDRYAPTSYEECTKLTSKTKDERYAAMGHTCPHQFRVQDGWHICSLCGYCEPAKECFRTRVS